MRWGISFDELAAVLQIRRGNEGKNYPYYYHKTYFVTLHLMRDHNICFHREKEKILLNYPQYPSSSRALISSVTGLLHNRIMTPNIQEYLSLRTKTAFWKGFLIKRPNRKFPLKKKTENTGVYPVFFVVFF